MLGMTKRTLQRNLKSNGILFKQAKEQVRKSKAKQLLDETDLSVQEISWQVVTVIWVTLTAPLRLTGAKAAPSYRNSGAKKHKGNYQIKVRSNNRT